MDIAEHHAALSYPRERLNEFLRKLTCLSGEFGLAVSGDPHLFVMTEEDRQFSYAADEQSRLILR